MSPTSKPEILLYNRFLSYLIWQSIPSTLIFILSFFLLPQTPFWSLVPFLTFHFIFSVSLSLVSSPSPHPIFLNLKLSLTFLLFITASALSGSVAALSFSGFNAFGRLGLRGFLVGLIFGFHYVVKRRWVLDFPIIQVKLFNQMGFIKFSFFFLRLFAEADFGNFVCLFAASSFLQLQDGDSFGC